MRFQLLLAWSYAARIDAGILPRPLTLNPCPRAHDLNSEVLTRFPLFCADTVVGALLGCFLDVLDLVLALPLRAAAVLGKRLADTDGFSTDGFSSGEETTRVTLYMAPRTRTASSSDSVESMVTFKIVACLWIRPGGNVRRCLFDMETLPVRVTNCTPTGIRGPNSGERTTRFAAFQEAQLLNSFGPTSGHRLPRCKGDCVARYSSTKAVTNGTAIT